jgi:hypothetical protein
MAVRIENHAEPIPGYKLMERLGGGGFGEVWKAEAPGGLHKAIKFVYGDLETAGDEGMRAEQELKALSRVKSVRHPYILSLERFDIIDGQLMIVMELADRNLWDRFRECRTQGLPGIPREELLRYMEETAEALDLMNNEYQLQHLDIKPQNLFLVHNHAKVADFGLVKDLQGMMASVTGGVTPVYAAPETFDGWISRFCDQYSLAIVYQELLTGQRPFAGNNIRQLILQHLQASPNLSSLPPSDRDAIARALAKNPDDRFPSCMELIRTLRGNVAAPANDYPMVVQEPRSEARPTDSTTGEETPCFTLSKSNGAAPVTCLAQDIATPQPLLGQANRDPGWIRVHQVAERAAPVAQTPAKLPAETQGEGVLFPALVIGLGQLGFGVLQRLRAQLQAQVGPLETMPHIRLLYVDTDPEAARHASRGRSAAALGRDEILLTRLNRPSHYLRSHDGRSRIDSWFNTKMLYRIPRNLVTTGLRALGRLAFLDNYRTIARRLRRELLACADPEGLAAAVQRTGLGMRSNHPRVYVVTGLAGGTGGGMFLDLAYVVKHLLRQIGCTRCEVTGIFLMPAVDRQASQTLALANAFAALTELNHFSTQGTTFSVRYDEKEAAINDAEAPFSRILTLELPSNANDEAPVEVSDSSADYLFRELLTPLGRATEEARAAKPTTGRPCPGPKCQTFGLYRISWPRQALLHNVARRLCQQIVQRWMTKDATAVRDSVRTLVAEVWQRQQLGGEFLLERLQAACKESLGEDPEALFARWNEPLAQLDLRSGEGVSQAVAGVLGQLENVLGRVETNVGARGGSLEEPLNATAEKLIASYGQQLTGFAIRLIEQPPFRLAGTEEATRQIVANVEQVLAHHEALSKELTGKAAEAQERIMAHLAAVRTGAQTERRKGPPAVAALLELLQVYPKWRYQSLLLKRVLSTYVSLRGHLSDQLREINYCRDRLADLRRSFENPDKSITDADEPGCGRNVFPFGCRNLSDTVKQLTESISTDDLRDLDTKMQDLIQGQFTSLVHVCMTSSNLLQNLEAAMQREAEGFVAARLAGINLTELYLKNQGGAEEVKQDLLEIANAAAPHLSGQRFPPQAELRVLAIPPGPAAERLHGVAEEVLEDVKFVSAPGVTDIIFYRESPGLPLAEFGQLGPLAYEAYRTVSGIDSFTPHSRTDISEWRAAVVS